MAAEWYPKKTYKTQMEYPITGPYYLLSKYPPNNESIPWGKFNGTNTKYSKYSPNNP